MKQAGRRFLAVTLAALLLSAVVLLVVCLAPAPVEAQQMPPAPGQQAPPPAQKAPAPAPRSKQAAAKPAAAKQPAAARVVKRRDPFRSLVMRPEDLAGGQTLPPGKRGLLIPQLSLNGVVVTTTGNIAVVTMAGRNRAYFLRERDEVYNGYVAQIADDSVTFKEKTTDAFGKEYEREVIKQITVGSGAKR